MYRLIPLRALRRTTGVKFDEIVPSDIPKIDGIDKVIHGPNSISPGPVNNITRPWYKHSGQDDNLLVLQGTRYVDIYDPKTKDKASFVITPDKVYKNDKLYYDGPAMVVWPSGIFHRIISGDEGSISINFATRTKDFDLKDNFNIYDLDTRTGEHICIKNGIEDQPNFDYKWPNQEIRDLVKNDGCSITKNNKNRDNYKNQFYEETKISQSNTLEMFNDQHWQEYKEFKRRAAAERFARGTEYN